MLNRSNNPEQQFEAVEYLLTRWLKERRALLGKYTEIVVTLDSHLDNEALEQCQKALCELLVDYVSAGHFEVFHELGRPRFIDRLKQNPASSPGIHYVIVETARRCCLDNQIVTIKRMR